MSSLYTLASMAMIRYDSVVRYERSWHIVTNDKFFTSRFIQQIWGSALILAIPPAFGVGKYVKDDGAIRYFSCRFIVKCIIMMALKFNF